MNAIKNTRLKMKDTRDDMISAFSYLAPTRTLLKIGISIRSTTWALGLPLKSEKQTDLEFVATVLVPSVPNLYPTFGGPG